MSTTENNYQETDLGNVSLNPRGEYDPGASYEYLDTVSYQGGSYMCLAELGTTITGIAPDPGRNTDAWQMLTLPGDLKPEYIAMHDDTVNHARQAESSRLAAELAQQAAEDAQADIQQLHTDTRQAATEAGQSRDSAAGYAQSADASRKAAAESEQNINAQVTGFDTKVSESVTQAQEEIATTRQQAIQAVASQQVTSTQAVKDQTASYIAEKETSAKTEIGNYTSEKIAEINKKASEANTTLANTITDGTSLKTQLEATISSADTSKKNLDASNTAAGKTKTALDVSNTTATKTKADLDVSNTAASKTKTGLDETNKTAAGLVTSLGNKITEGTQVKTDIQTTGETAMSNLQAEAAKQQEFIQTSIDDTLSISGKAADAAAVGKKTAELSTDLNLLKEYVKGMNLPETWEQVVLAIKSKLHREMYVVGDKFSNIWKDTNNSNKEYDNPLRINHFEDGLELEDGTTVNGMWLQTVYAHLKGVQFSHQQAFYVSNEGMTAGTYCIGFDYTWGDKGYVTKGDYWNFTLTKDVPAGGKLAGFYGAPDQPQTNWRVYAYSADGKTVLETVSAVNKGQEGTLLGVMTAYGDENLNGIQQMAYGDNRYATSAIRQYLNSDKPKGEWWTAQTKWDIAPDQLSQIDGYLCGMDPELLAVLKPVKVVTYCNTVTATGQKQVKDITYDKVTLISLEQMYIEPQAAGEGEAHEYYKELNGTAKKFQWWQTYEILKTFAVENPTSPQYVRLRSASRNYAYNTWSVYSSGSVSYSLASSAFRPAPLMFIGAAPSDTISAPTDAESTQEDKSQEAVA